jgi:hypothetical protein
VDGSKLRRRTEVERLEVDDAREDLGREEGRLNRAALTLRLPIISAPMTPS